MLEARVKHMLMFFITLLIVVGNTQTLYALDHSGTISVDETWFAVDNPHVITGNVFVQNSTTPPTLTLEPGVVVQFNPNTSLRIGWSWAGKLNANGTATDPITFTSSQPSPSPGDWDEISFWVDPSGSVCNYCEIEYGGGGTYNANVHFGSGGGVSITNSTIRNSATYGVNKAGGASRLSAFSDNTLSDNGQHPVNIFANFLGDLGTGNTYSGNSPNRIRVNGDTVDTTQTWRNQGIPYEVMEDIWIQEAANPIVTINPGTTLLFNFDAGLFVGSSLAGGLVADGTSSDPITFSSVFVDDGFGLPGDWDGIAFWANTDDTNALCDYCIIEYGGGATNLEGNVFVNGAFPAITNSTIQYSEAYGVNVKDNSGFTAFEDNNVSFNGLNPIQIYGEFVRTLGPGNVYTSVREQFLDSNKFEEIRVIADTVTTSATWLDQGVDYLLAGTIRVRSSSPPFPALTLAPGVTLRFNPGARLEVGETFVGTLVAEGTPEEPITFTSWDTQNPTPGDWPGIEFSANATGSSIGHAVIEYGGDNNFGNLYIRSPDVAVSHSIISNSKIHGIYVGSGVDPELTKLRLVENVNSGIYTTGSGTDPTITESTFERNTYGVFATSSAAPIIGGASGSGNNFYDSRLCGVENTTGAITVDATYNWWGDASGPSGNGPGTGDAVCGNGTNVDFSSWLSKANPWVDIVDFWTSDLFNNKRRRFSPGDDIRYHLTFSHDNGKTSDSTIIMKGKLRGNTTDAGTWTHRLKKDKSGSFMFQYRTWVKTVPINAVIEELKARMLVKVDGAKDRNTIKVNIVP